MLRLGEGPLTRAHDLGGKYWREERGPLPCPLSIGGAWEGARSGVLGPSAAAHQEETSSGFLLQSVPTLSLGGELFCEEVQGPGPLSFLMAPSSGVSGGTLSTKIL